MGDGCCSTVSSSGTVRVYLLGLHSSLPEMTGKRLGRGTLMCGPMCCWMWVSAQSTVGCLSSLTLYVPVGTLKRTCCQLYADDLGQT